MTIPLTMAAENAPADEPWDEFLTRRDKQVARMEMATCDGCDSCGLRCTDGFLVTQAEYDAVQEYLATVPAGEVSRIAGQNKTLPWPGGEETGATVTFCRYRDQENGRCSVYPVRPTICRLFGHTPWLPCPIEAVQEIPEGSPELWGEYRAFERHTWAEWEALIHPTGRPEE